MDPIPAPVLEQQYLPVPAKEQQHPYLIEKGKRLGNGAQQLYDDILRQQKMINELTQKVPISAVTYAEERQQPRASVHMSPASHSTMTFTGV